MIFKQTMVEGGELLIQFLEIKEIFFDSLTPTVNARTARITYLTILLTLKYV